MTRSGYWKTTGMSVIVAVLGVIVVWIIARLIDGRMRVDTPQDDSQSLTVFLAAGSTVIYGILATVVGWVLIRTRRPRTWWFSVSAVVLLLLGLIAFISATETSTAIWMNIMHLVAAGAIVPTVSRFFARTTSAETGSTR